MSLTALKDRVRTIGAQYADREQRARRLYIEERSVCLSGERDREFKIKTDVSEFFKINYSSVCFCGSGQLGFSIPKDTLFQPTVSDLDIACIDVNLFQQAWKDIITTSRAFSDESVFPSRSPERIELFKNQLLKRGMILVRYMPNSDLSRPWKSFQDRLGREHNSVFGRVSVAIYMNEYAFCWKQDSALSEVMR